MKKRSTSFLLGDDEMKIKEVSEKFNISITALRYYEKVGLFDDVTRVNNIREYEDKDIDRISLILSLKKAGLHIQTILQYIHLLKEGHSSNSERVCILKKRRCELLDEIHQQQKNLDSLDYLIYQTKKGESYEK